MTTTTIPVTLIHSRDLVCFCFLLLPALQPPRAFILHGARQNLSSPPTPFVIWVVCQGGPHVPCSYPPPAQLLHWLFPLPQNLTPFSHLRTLLSSGLTCGPVPSHLVCRMCHHHQPIAIVTPILCLHSEGKHLSCYASLFLMTVPPPPFFPPRALAPSGQDSLSTV